MYKTTSDTPSDIPMSFVVFGTNDAIRDDVFKRQLASKVASCYTDHIMIGQATRNTSSTPLEISLINDKYKVTDPIQVSLSLEDGKCIYEIPDLWLFAFSPQIDEALKELREDIINLCDMIYAIPDNKLAEMPRKWKSYLHQHIMAVENA